MLRNVIGGVACVTYINLAAISSYTWKDVYLNPGQYFISFCGITGAVMLLSGCPNKRISLIEMISNGAIAIIGLHPLFIQYLRRGLLLLHFNFTIDNVWQWLLYSAIVFACCVVTIPIIDKTMPILIGKNKNKI